MRFAIWFGIAAFLLSGSLFNAFAHNAEGVLGLAFIVGVAAAFYGSHLQAQREFATDNPAGKIYGCSKQLAFHRIKDILVAHCVGHDSWSFSQLDAEGGRLVATLNFTEQMAAFGPSPNLPDQPRRITLSVTMASHSNYQCLVQLHWLVSSPVNRDNCDTVISHITGTIDSTLSSPLARSGSIA